MKYLLWRGLWLIPLLPSISFGHEGVPEQSYDGGDSSFQTPIADPSAVLETETSEGKTNSVTSVRTIRQPRPQIEDTRQAQQGERAEEGGIPLGVRSANKDVLIRVFTNPGSNIIEKIVMPGGEIVANPRTAQGEPLLQRHLINTATGKSGNLRLFNGAVLGAPIRPVPYSITNQF